MRSDLWVIEVRQALSSEALWQLALDGDILHLVTQQLMVNVARHRGLVHSKCLQGALHPTVTRRGRWGRRLLMIATYSYQRGMPPLPQKWNKLHLINFMFSERRHQFSAYLSKEVDFQTKSTWKLWGISTGAPTLLRNSMAISSP